MPNPQTALKEGLRIPNDQNRYEIKQEDLPIHCPLPDTSLWNSHPRVYVAFNAKGYGKCIYCGAEYALVDKVKG